MSNAAFDYPPPEGQGSVGEQYRASPTGSNSAMPLPGIRSIETVQQQQQQQPQQQPSMAGAHLPLPPNQLPGGFYHNQGPTLPHPPYPSITSDPTGPGNMRYALPISSDNRGINAGRHKKEIKRRTKTGCLTCRKRRIKCDEQHPTCRNCQKSKRECLGYDPIFKSQPGPAAIQPAPSSAPSQTPLHATANPYGAQPQILSSYAATMPYVPSLAATVGAPVAGAQFDYASAIDPTLEASSAATSAVGVQLNPSIPGKRTVLDLLAIGGVAPPPAPQDQNLTSIEETKHLYYSIYAPGLENFLESKWFSAKGLNKLLGDKCLMDLFGSLLVQFQKPNTDDSEIRYTSSVEARAVWALACNAQTGAVELNGTRSTGLVPTNDDPVEAAHRLAVFEALLTGKVLTRNQLTQPVPGSTDHHRLRELEFWYTLANFVGIHEDDPTSEIDKTLAALRTLLDGRENRDVLYSIAVVRAIGQRVSDYSTSDIPHHFDETDDRSKLSVAKKFLIDQANGGGTTNVIRRFCELATRTWPSTSPETSTASPAPKPESSDHS